MILDTAQLHPTYRAIVGPLLDQLMSAYPSCPLEAVEVVRGAAGDRSLGNADTPGKIQLNGYWFRDRPIEALEAEAERGYLFSLPGSEQVLRWHGGMREPQHAICHEFFHVLSDVLPGYREWAEEQWLDATGAPGAAVSGYALSGPEEWFAEACAASWLRIDHPSARETLAFLSRES